MTRRERASQVRASPLSFRAANTARNPHRKNDAPSHMRGRSRAALRRRGMTREECRWNRLSFRAAKTARNLHRKNDAPPHISAG